MSIKLYTLFVIFGVISTSKASIKYPMVLFEKDLSRSAVFVFHQNSRKPLNVTLTDHLGAQFSFKTVKRKPFGVPCCVHEVEFKKLSIGSKYKITVEGEKRTFWFETAKETGKILLGGDSRSDSKMRVNINQAIKSYVKKNPDTFALIHGGDYIKNGWSWSQWKCWLKDYQTTTSESGRLLPLIPIRGNHEYLSFYFNSLFSRPSGGIYKNYYVTQWNDLSFIHLNTNLSHSGNQKDWLQSKLKKLSKESKWIIPNYHRPAYPAVKKPGDALRYWVPLFEKYQVDVVFESDGHVYKKTAPIFNGKIDREKGIRYLGEGGLGVPLREPEKSGEWYFSGDGRVEKKYHFFSLEKRLDKIFIHSVDEKLNTFDSVQLRPKTR
jgi:acid phosphatase type 7